MTPDPLLQRGAAHPLNRPVGSLARRRLLRHWHREGRELPNPRLLTLMESRMPTPTPHLGVSLQCK